jgi:hypothetical protein
MLKFLSKLFKTPEEPLTELNLSTFPAWFEKEVAQSSFSNYVPLYFQRLAELKEELQDKARILQETEIPEEHQKGTTPRVKTIVLGNKQHYVQAVEHFSERISLPANLHPKIITELQQVQQFNQNLNQRLDDFSRISEKSYHAAKHLFYDEVDEIAKVFKAINDVLLKCGQRAQELVIMIEIEQNFIKLRQETHHKENLLPEIQIKQETIKKLTSQYQELQEDERRILNSTEYHNYLKLKEEEKEQAVQLKQVNDKVYSFLSKLNKPLRKYQYDTKDKIIEAYLTDCVQAFWNDEKLKIIPILDALKESLQLNKISFEEKSQKSYLEQIEAKEELQEFKEQRKELQSQLQKIAQKLSANSALLELEQNQAKQKQVEQDIAQSKTELLELQQKLEKVSLVVLKDEISKSVNKIFNKKITL